MSAAAKLKSAARAEAPAIKVPGLAPELSAIVHVLTCGSVDDGKSTLIGRLLWDAADVPDDTRATIAKSAGEDGVPDLSLLVDGLAAEREQGITIDVAWRYFDAGRRRFVIIDSPGHEQYTRNMACGASHADVAIMLIDARHGIKTQTRRHAAILDLMGVRRVVLAVNKMDLVDWSESAFRAIERDFGDLARRFGFADAVAIPVAARLGDNVVNASARMSWYAGPTLLDHLSRAHEVAADVPGPFRFPVQTVLRGDGDYRDFRGLAGTVASGSVRVGSVVQDSASGRQARVKRILTMDGDRDIARADDAVALELDVDLDVSRGSVLAAPDALPTPARSLTARLVWLSETALDTDHGLLLRTATDLVPIAAIEIKAKLDLATLEEIETSLCQPNDVLIADLALARAVAVDRFVDNHEMGAFVLVDALTGNTLAGGVIAEAREGDGQRRQGQFVLTRSMLEQGVCAGIMPTDPEFRRRTQAVADILAAAGVSLEIEDVGL